MQVCDMAFGVGVVSLLTKSFQPLLPLWKQREEEPCLPSIPDYITGVFVFICFSSGTSQNLQRKGTYQGPLWLLVSLAA